MVKIAQTAEFNAKMKNADKVETTVEQHISEYDGKTYIDFKFVIKELYGYGVLLFNPPLIVNGSIEVDGEIAYYDYDFGMSDKVCVNRQDNYLYNYDNANAESNILKTILNTIKYDLQHAFNHIDMDPNYSHTHWALRAELRDRTTSYDMYEDVVTRQTEFDFDKK
jgi:hypothetical protein